MIDQNCLEARGGVHLPVVDGHLAHTVRFGHQHNMEAMLYIKALILSSKCMLGRTLAILGPKLWFNLSTCFNDEHNLQNFKFMLENYISSVGYLFNYLYDQE